MDAAVKDAVDSHAADPATSHENAQETSTEERIVAESVPLPPDETDEEVEVETPKLTHDSMVTVRLSEPPSLILNTTDPTSPNHHDEDEQEQEQEPVTPNDKQDADDKLDDQETTSEPDTVITNDAHNTDTARARASSSTNNSTAPSPTDEEDMARLTRVTLERIDTSRTLQDELDNFDSHSHASDSSDDFEEVNWEQLEKTEDEQPKDEESDSTALLLARLEQENAKLATNPKTAKVQAVERLQSSKSRPPSIAKLRQMVNEPTSSTLRYSLVPPPPMTDLEFYAALVKDYQQTAARLPTLLSNKIRKGIPPPLRGVVWQSMSGARDVSLERQYDRLSGESSPYELLIGKDLGRSFPGVDMFREAGGEGQLMLGRVLKCFSLYDTKIGYCQGLAFLVGPLLMHMPDKQAFCVLVRLMEQYDLRACFLPDLSGLHVRIYQFRELLRQHLPGLAAHMEELQVETAYVSQWFLSFFAVTCPLPMLFRIYDVLFAEGASETLMRVALSLMRKNEARLLACTELEDVMQLLLSRGLWDCYHYDADDFVQDFASLSGAVTRERLAQLEQGYKESLIATANAARVSDITTAATRFLGRLWASTPATTTKTPTLTPGLSAPGRPLSILKRSPSKQSIASTLNSVEASSASLTSSLSTDETAMSRDFTTDESSRESTPVAPKGLGHGKSTDDRYLHSQIEDLLTALTELQRNQALLANQLQREREERDEDKRAVQSLLEGLRRKASTNDATTEAPEESEDDSDEADAESDDAATTPLSDNTEKPLAAPVSGVEDAPSTEDLSELLDRVEKRFALTDGNKHRSSMMMTKSQLREELMHAKGELAIVSTQCQDLNRRVHDMDEEMSTLKEQLRERHGHVRTLHNDKQRLEKQLQMMRATSNGADSDVWPKEMDPDWGAKSVAAGLRELKLGRSKSTPNSQPGKRISSMPLVHDFGSDDAASEHDALLVELAQAKTAEAMAKQDAEEAKQKLEAMRKAYGIPVGDSPTTATTPTGAMGVFSRFAGPAAAPTNDTPPKAAASAGANMAATVTGAFWGWRR